MTSRAKNIGLDNITEIFGFDIKMNCRIFKWACLKKSRESAKFLNLYLILTRRFPTVSYAWVPLAPDLRILAFEKRLRETERSYNVMNSVKRSGRGCSIINSRWNLGQIKRPLSIKKSEARISQIWRFWTLIADRAGLRGHSILQRLAIQLQLMKKKRFPDVFTPF